MITNHMMQNIFSASLCSSFFTIIIIGLRKFFIKYISSIWYYYTWFCIFIPWFIIWFSRIFFTKLSFFIVFFTIKNLNILLSNHHNHSNIIPNLLTTIDNGPSHSHTKIIFMIWLIGVIIFLLYFIFQHLQCNFNLKKRSKKISKQHKKLLKTILEKNQHQQLKRIYFLKYIQSPMLCQIIKPRIYLPRTFFTNYTAIEQRYILQHELLHLNRHDVLTNAIVFVLICLNWFNPIMILAYRHFRQAQELSCDAMITRNFTSVEKRTYGYALLKTVINLTQKNSIGSCWWNIGIELKERCKMLSYHRSKISISLIGLSLFITTTLMMFVITSLEYRDSLFIYSMLSAKSSDFVIKMFNNTSISYPLFYHIKMHGKNLAEGLLGDGDGSGEFIFVRGSSFNPSEAEIIIENAAHTLWKAKVVYNLKNNDFTTNTFFVNKNFIINSNTFPTIHTITYNITSSLPKNSF